MTHTIVFIYQHQKCVFATLRAILNSLIVPEKRIIEKKWVGNNNIFCQGKHSCII